MKKLAAASLLLALAGCDRYHYHAGRFCDATHRELGAVAHYEKFLADRPSDPRAAEVHVRAGRIYASQRRCLEARRHFEAAARGFPNLEPWERLAKAGVMDCPDYFPLDAGRSWTYGDSASRGKAMRLDERAQGFADRASGAIESALFAGLKKVRAERRLYEKRDWGVWELRGSERSLVLRYPFRKGEAWTTTRGGERLDFLIEDDAATAATAAGSFSGCLKVREYNPRFPGSWKYDYFAPFVGRVKTTVAGPGYEKPNSELLAFTP